MLRDAGVIDMETVMTDEELKERFGEVFCLNQDTGHLVWKVTLCGRAIAGNRAGSLKVTGYRRVRVDGKFYQEHRIVFLMAHGYMPEQVDHVNGIKNDNRVSNLRSSNNRHNKRAYRKPVAGASSKYRGVSWHKPTGKWQAKIWLDGKQQHIGSFDCELSAAKAYDQKAMEYGYDEQALNRTHHAEVGE